MSEAGAVVTEAVDAGAGAGAPDATGPLSATDPAEDGIPNASAGGAPACGAAAASATDSAAVAVAAPSSAGTGAGGAITA
jgi:hypothetical protein